MGTVRSRSRFMGTGLARWKAPPTSGCGFQGEMDPNVGAPCCDWKDGCTGENVPLGALLSCVARCSAKSSSRPRFISFVLALHLVWFWLLMSKWQKCCVPASPYKCDFVAAKSYFVE